MARADAAACLRAVVQAVAAGQTVVVWCGAGQPRDLAAQVAREVGEQLVAAAATAVSTSAWRISRSATDGLAAVAVSATQHIGIDVERISRDPPAPAEVLAWLHPNERASYAPGSPAWRPEAVWSRKEAVLKALGVGLALRPEAVDAGAWSSDWRLLTVPLFGPVRLCSVETPGATGSVAAAVAIAGAGPSDAELPLRLTSWPG